MQQAKRRQHYVWQSYLKAWVFDNTKNKIWSSHEGRVGEKYTSQLVWKDFFYELKPINQEEREFFQLLFLRKCSQDVQERFISLIDNHNELFRKKSEWDLMCSFISVLGGESRLPQELQEEYRRHKRMSAEIDIAIKNTRENYHSEIETEASKWLCSLKRRNLDFFSTDELLIIEEGYSHSEAYRFLLFLCMQYFRTKRRYTDFKKGIEKNLKNPEMISCLSDCRIDAENVKSAHVIPWLIRLQEEELANYLLVTKASLVLLVNNTDLPFITSDQPVVNLRADYQSQAKNILETVFYYPISPCLAVIVNEPTLSDAIELCREQVELYNQKIASASYQHLFSNDRATLEAYINPQEAQPCKF